jgi:hypothetical protein
MCVCGFGIDTVKDIWGVAAGNFSACAAIAVAEAKVRNVSIAALKAEEYFWFIVICLW